MINPMLVAFQAKAISQRMIKKRPYF